MNINSDLPSHEELFGQLDFKQGDDGRSVYSPAAYLVDLLQLLDDKFKTQKQGLATKRPDIKTDLHLNTENTYTPIPYLDIANEVLEKKIEGQAYEVLKSAKYPFNLPFNFQNERVKKYLNYLDVTLEELYKLFSVEVTSNVVAREYLLLSQEEYDTFIVANSETLNQYWGEKFDFVNQNYTNLMVPNFLDVADISSQQLRELLYQNLSRIAKDSDVNVERVKVTDFFINHQLGGYVEVKLDKSEEKLQWNGSNKSIPEDWFERVNRFIRLAKKINLTFTDLDIILRSCCNNNLNEKSIQIIATVKKIHDQYEIPIDIVCSFFSDINIIGIGDDDEPQDLFNRIFNSKFATIEKKYISVSQFIPNDYSDYTLLTCSGDILSLNNKEYRKPLGKALNITEKELIYIVDKFRNWSALDESRKSLLDIDREIGLASLSLLFRITKLSEILDISITDLFNLLDILEKEPSIRSHHNFKILIDYPTQEQDCYKILQGENTDDLMWLISILFAVVSWMQIHDFASEELKQILAEEYMNKKVDKNGKFEKDLTNLYQKEQAEKSRKEKTKKSQKISYLNNLYQQFKSVMFSADILRSDIFDRRGANILYQTLTEKESPLVSNKDKRILKTDQSSLKILTYKALKQLEVISPDDFTMLGLEQKVLDKIFNNLIIHKYMNAEGYLNEKKFSPETNDFKIDTDFSKYKAELWDIIKNVLVKEIEFIASDRDVDNELEDVDNELEDVEISIYLSDIESLKNLTESQRNELYDNLIFNGYINEEGKVLQIEFFAQEDNVDEFEVNSNIGNAAKDIFKIITAQTANFEQESLILNKDIFVNLPLKDFERDDLIENLKLNDYLDEKNVITKKGELLNIDVNNFNLALMFYPYRYKILAALQELIDGFKSKFYTFSKDIFGKIADKIVAQWVYEDIASQYLEEGSIKKEQESFFLDSENLPQLTLRNYFTPSDAEAVFNKISNIITVYKKYRFNNTVLEEYNFNIAEQEELIELLEEEEVIIENGILSEKKLDYFLKIDNALIFTLDKFEDYNKDIFFVFHGIAKEIDASISEVSKKLKDLEEKQNQLLFMILQDAFGIQADTVKVLCQNIFQTTEDIVEAFIIPVLSVVNLQDKVTTEPNNNKFNYAYKRIKQFSALVTKLGLSTKETAIVFDEQNLVEKFPEHLVLPETIDSFDALVESPEGIIYIFKDDKYWVYSAETYNLLDQKKFAEILKSAGYSEKYIDRVTKDNTIASLKDNTITSLSENFENLTKVDAAFVDSNGTLSMIVKDTLYCRERGSERWVKKDRVWGKVENNFDDPEKIDAAFQDKEGKTYLFAGDQYIRYSTGEYNLVDKGYPLKIANNWQKENFPANLPQKFQTSIDAAFQGLDRKTYLFKENNYLSSDSLNQERPINEKWGQVKNNFNQHKPVDAAYIDGSRLILFLDNQLIAYKNSLENDGVTVEEGFPMLLKSYYENQNLPSEFENGVDAAFKGTDEKIYLFKERQVASVDTANNTITVAETKGNWGIVRNNILETGTIDAAFVGLEGKTYLFSGNQYFRYSGDDYTQVDEGFPRTIEDDWGGLHQVDAAFIVDGKTYLFGKDADNNVVYVCYSNNDYTEQDEGYPKSPNDNWWNLSFELVQQGTTFKKIDAVFNGYDGKTYLFSGNQFIYFDHQQRWWSEPAALNTYWDSIPFNTVSAAFTGKDGKTYIFSGEEYLRYSGPNYNQVDDRYPNMTNRYWGNVVNHITKTGKVDAAVVVESHEVVNEQEKTTKHTYLFSGNQYVRYSGNKYDVVDEGYPKYIATSLKKEPRFKNLDFSGNEGIDAAFADRRNLYLFKGTKWYVISEDLSKVYDLKSDLDFDTIDCAFVEQGNLFIEKEKQWHYCTSLEGKERDKMQILPTVLRNVPEDFKTELNAVLQGVDNNTYLFKGRDCFNVSLKKEYPLAEEFGRVKNNIQVNDTIDAAFVGRDGKTYLFSGNQYVVYAEDSYDKQGNYIYGGIKGNAQKIQDYWGGLTSVTLAFVREEKTYLFEKPDEEGNSRYICYSTEDYSQPDPGFPKTASRYFWQIPDDYSSEGFKEIDAVLFEDENMFLISKEQYIQYNTESEQWNYPKPLSRIWREIPLENENFKVVKTAFMGRDSITYFFSDKYYVKYENKQFSEPLPIK